MMTDRLKIRTELNRLKIAAVTENTTRSMCIRT